MKPMSSHILPLNWKALH